ncbi:S8/S53 family peptidase [Aspergillus homomorphus CBS 101889]|uniref:Subtilisin-like protein n=1 Tax=Aspergillus homomorphus (strain CBS 101889) TaxID=1450537 RepID=A0A395HTR7_ASPHC|nr:subtilisin-like protein [Aspergillus homomorphus CBS 101889]RAL09604.1 subtilisin-like protein [Aspergillus homomorphus CBS 101889]
MGILGEKASAFDSNKLQQSQTTEEWFGNFKVFCQFLAKRNGHADVKTKIAVLDTGIDAEHEFVKAHWRRDGLQDRGYQDFTGAGTDPHGSDVDGHGTHVAGIILRSAPHVDLYVVRIAARRKDLRRDREIHSRVAKALKYAINKLEVDVISMSFGLEGRTREIDEQLRAADGKGIVLFGAASNDGNQQLIPYPARSRFVFGIHASDIDCQPARFTPSPQCDCVNFGILGIDILSIWSQKSKESEGVIDSQELAGRAKYMSGTSVATPLAAALAASVLTYCRMNAAELALREPLENYDYIYRVFSGMSVGSDGGYKMLLPWKGDRGRFRSYEEHLSTIMLVTLLESA